MSKITSALAVVLILALAASAQIVLYEEHFTDGNMALNWQAGYGDTLGGAGNSMEVDFMPGNPSGDGFIGKVGNNLSGGNVGLTYAGDIGLTDYTLTAYVYTTVSSGLGPYNSLAFRFNPELDTLVYYYQFDADFDTDQRLRFRKKLTGFPEVIRDWSAGEIPGGIPAQSGWHEMSVNIEGTEFWLFWDGQELPGCPYTDAAIPNGYFGVYIFNFMNPNDFTMVDDVVVTGEDTTGVRTGVTIVPLSSNLLDAYPNPFNPSTTLSFALEKPGPVRLAVYDTQGKQIAVLLNGAYLPAGLHKSIWDAQNLPAGVYLTRLESDQVSAAAKVVLVK